MCSQTNSNELKIIALDCIGKLFSFSYLEDPEAPAVDPQSGITPPPQIPLMDRAIKTVCDCFTGEGTDSKVELQIIKALMAAVLNDDLIAHGATLLKAIRQTYTIFVLSTSPANQSVAQATLSQMVNVIFDRLKPLIKRPDASFSSPNMESSSFSVTDLPSAKENTQSPSESTSSLPSKKKLTLRQMETMGSTGEIERVKEDLPNNDEDESDLFAKDAFLVFRTLCRLSEKSLEGDGLDIRSHGMRSKLLSLHLIHTILKSHMSVFYSNEIVIRSNVKGDEPFLLSVKDYICSTLARNAASISPPIFEISAEIFWLIVSNLRSQFKKEIEVFFAEIYFPITEMKTSTAHQKQYFLSIVQKLSNDPRALVEIYLNYDCDSSAAINIYESLIDFLVRQAVSPIHLTSLQLQQYLDAQNRPIAVYNLSLPPAMAISHVSLQPHNEPLYPIEYALKMTALQSLVAVLRSLITWSQRGIAAVSASLNQPSSRASITEGIEEDVPEPSSTNGTSTPLTDDPSQFKSLKIKKTAFLEAIRQFNIKPKRGVKAFISSGIVENDDPIEIAKILLNTEGLDKALIGEYLGEGDPENIAIMHAFVDLMDFTNMSFVDALRRFLQAFRLPGEAQKIDRYMLKFAERYISGNPTVFANADTAYVLAYSVIMLNTDLHSRQVKIRMTPNDFVRNNRGINDNADLPEEYLLDVYATIRDNEIKLLSEQHAALLSADGQQTQSGFASGIGQALATVGRDLQREAYMQASREMSNKTEQLFKSLISRSDGKKRSGESIFYIASHIEHIKPMFEVAWMSFLAGLSGPFQETEDPETIKLCLEGFKLSIRIACLFDIDLARISFVSALAQFTNLQKLSEMKQKNVSAVKQLLNTALSEGNNLKSSWKEILTCISQLERFQLISSGIAAGSIPDVTNARLASHRDSTETQHQLNRMSSNGGLFSGFGMRSSAQTTTTSSAASIFSASNASTNTDRQVMYSAEFGEELQSREVVITMDKIFTRSASLSGDGIVDFVRALTEVSWEEIQSSGLSEHPRTFSLQKMVDVCYYNMERIRFEWSQLWAIMGKSFNQVGCHENTSVVFFALDSLRQLSMRFFDLEELSHFKFQKDFLEPFEYVMANNDSSQAKDMVLQCLRQMILAKSERIKSGWRTMFGTFSAAAKQPFSSVVNETFELVKKIHTDHLEQVISQDSFGSMVTCLSEISKNQHFQKPSLHSLELLKNTIMRILERSKDPANAPSDESALDDSYVKFWFPVLLAFHDVIMNGEDLEVRSRALNYMFDTLVEYGSNFSPEFWDTVCRQLLFPIFVVLKSRSEMARFNTQDDISVWLSTTMIQALRNMIALLSHYFEILSRMLDGFLDLLVTCILQENETVSRIGSSCVLQLIEQNVEKLTPENWTEIVDKIEFLFKSTTAFELFGACFADDEEVPQESDLGSTVKSTNGSNDVNIADPQTPTSSARPEATLSSTHFNDSPDTTGGSPQVSPKVPRGNHSVSSADANQKRQKRFRKTIVKCILQLLMIDTAQELLERQETHLVEATPAQSTNGGNGTEHAVTQSEPRIVGSEIYERIPVKELVRILDLLRRSYVFSRDFNEDRDLRTNLWRQGFMKQLPNLLKQESFSAHTYVSVMIRFYTDQGKLTGGGETLDPSFSVFVDEDADGVVGAVSGKRREANGAGGVASEDRELKTITTSAELKSYVEGMLLPMCVEIITRYNDLDPTETRNIKAWTPVTVCILEGFASFAPKDFVRIVPTIYPVVLAVLNRDMSSTLRLAVQKVLQRVNDCVLKGKSHS